METRQNSVLSNLHLNRRTSHHPQGLPSAKRLRILEIVVNSRNCWAIHAIPVSRLKLLLVRLPKAQQRSPIRKSFQGEQLNALRLQNNRKYRGKRSWIATSLRYLGKNSGNAGLAHSFVKFPDPLFENLFLCRQQPVDLFDQFITNRNRLSSWPIVTVTDDANETT